MRAESGCSELARHWENDNNVTICRHDAILKILWCCRVSLIKFSYWSSFMSLSFLVLELWQFLFIRDWQEIGKSKILLSGFRLGRVKDTNFIAMSRMKCCWMLQNARVTIFTVWVINGKPTCWLRLPTPLPKIRIKLSEKIRKVIVQFCLLWLGKTLYGMKVNPICHYRIRPLRWCFCGLHHNTLFGFLKTFCGFQVTFVNFSYSSLLDMFESSMCTV